MDCGIELIDFSRPTSSRKNLYVTNIPSSASEVEIVAHFCETFGEYGLLYGVQVYPSQLQLQQRAGPRAGGYYAFVTFYSSVVAARAKEALQNSVVLHNTVCKIAFAKPKKEAREGVPLHFTRCYALASCYLGFNSWSTSIKTLYLDKQEKLEDTRRISYVCVISLQIKDLLTDGIGVAEESYDHTDHMARIQATCRCQKLAHQHAVENAFSKVILVVLGNGKVSVEIDTTKPDPLHREHKDDQLVTVNNLDQEPASEEDEEAAVNNGDTDAEIDVVNDFDDLNVHILQELEDEM